MSTSQNDDPVSREPGIKETGLVRRSVFLTKRVRELARQVRTLEPVERPGSQDARSYRLRGMSDITLGQYEQAIQDYDEAIRLDPTHSPTQIGAGLAATWVSTNRPYMTTTRQSG